MIIHREREWSFVKLFCHSVPILEDDKDMKFLDQWLKNNDEEKVTKSNITKNQIKKIH